MIKYIVYVFYNILYQLMLIWFLSYANTYLNDFFIPSSFRWEDNQVRRNLIPYGIIQTTILALETVILILPIYFFNKYFLTQVSSNNPRKIAIYTRTTNIIITFLFIGIYMYLIYTNLS
jgi:hypothetical protein